MSGHSKWSQIRRGKAIVDAKRGQIFTRHAKNIQLAARSGGDPSMNTALANMIELAKADNMPRDNIERAIKKGSGALGADLTEEKIYEGYGPGGTALLIRTLTDNPNRTVGNLRHLLAKHGGKLSESGTVAFQFEKRGIITVENPSETSELAAIEAGAMDLENTEALLIVKTQPKDLMAIRKKLLEAKCTVKSAQLEFEPLSMVTINDKETAEKILHLVELLEEDDDVDSVSSNFDIPEELLL